MSKINIKYSLISPSYKINKKISGIKDGNRIVYIDDNVKTTLTLGENICLKRECKDYNSIFIFDEDNETKGKYILNMYNLSLDLNIKTYVLEVINNHILIKYNLDINDKDEELFIYSLDYEII